jgi:ATP synthase protein I
MFRERNQSLSPWRVVVWQIVTGVVVALVAFAVSGKQHVGWSAAYGALAVVLPGAVFARGLTGRLSSLNPGTAVFGFFLWEMAKIALSVGLMVAAPRWIDPLSWPALLVGLVVTMKVYWVAMVVKPKKLKQTNE